MSRVSRCVTVQEELPSLSKPLSPTLLKHPTPLTAVPKTLFIKTFKSFSRAGSNARGIGVELCMENLASKEPSQDGGTVLEELSSANKAPIAE